MRVSRVLLVAALLPIGCASYVSDAAPDRMRNMSMKDLFACAGFPSQKMQVDDDLAILEYDPKTSANSGTGGVKTGVSVELPLGTSFTYSTPTNTCHMQITLARDGTVYDVNFTSSDPVKGLDGACAELVKQCVFNPSDTGHKTGYDAWKWLFAETTPPTKGKAP